MKKFLIATLAAVCFICLGLAVACKKGPKYYTLSCDARGGLVINFLTDNEGAEPLRSGAEVKEGYNVRFTLGLESGEDDAEALDGAVVTANENVLESGEDGVYSFTMTADTDLVAQLNKYLVKFDSNITSGGNVIDTRTKFFSDDGNTETGIYANPNDTVSFTVKRSVYYVGDFEITANDMVVTPDTSGVYNITVTENTTVAVKGLKMDTPFYRREDGGDGSEKNPFKISRPVDLFAMSDLIGDDFYAESRPYAAFYELTNDIDLEGEQMFVIGDSTTQTAFFGGNFNGNGHTISDYYISDTVYDTSVVNEDGTYGDLFLPYVGMFGYAQATAYGTAEIYNLNLEDFTINVDSARFNTGCYVGGVVGYGAGVNITGCSVNGAEITVTADESYFAYAGGIAGAIQAAYQSETVRYFASVRSCSSSAEVVGLAGCVYGVGGIVGYLCTYNETSATAPAYLLERTPAFVINSYSTGNVYGGLNAGGIVGLLSPLSSVSGCYSTGSVYADCRIPYESGYELYAYAYAGGVAGYAGYGSVISDSFSAAAVAAVSVNGNNWQKAGGIAGLLQEGGSTYDETNDAIAFNCYSVMDNANITFDRNFYTNTLKWHEADWVFGDGYPTVNLATVNKNFTVTVNFKDAVQVNGAASLAIAISDTYIPMSYWNLRSGGIPEFIVSDNGLKSFGYYFDEALTQKVPFSYVPVNDVTLYVGFADYSEVSGTYYLKTSTAGSGVYIELREDGTLFYRDGALNYTSFYSYVYDGTNIILYDNLIGELFSAYPDYELEYYSTLLATAEGNTLSISGTVYNLVPVYDDEGEVVSYNKLAENIAAMAVKKVEGFAYGKYYAGSSEYVFNTDGTGLTAAGDKFTYTVQPDGADFDLVLTVNGSPVQATVSNGKLTVGGSDYQALDIFAGVWEREAACYGQYEFDGKGGWSHSYYELSGGAFTLKTENGTYTVVGGNTLNLGNGKTVGFDNGLVIVDGETYYKESSYAGKWIFNGREPVEITFNGMTSDGYGTATINYGANYDDYEVTYASVIGNGGKKYIEIFYNDVLLGQLSFDEENTLVGSLYSAVWDTIEDNATFCLYDVFSGEWVSDDSVLSSIEFNGLGGYDLKKAGLLPVSGSIKIDGTEAGGYTLEDSLLSGSFAYNSVNYKVVYNISADTVTVTSDSGSFDLKKRDGWYGVELIDGDGSVYSFDGRGTLTNGGTLTVTPVSGAEQTLTYKVSGDAITISGSVSGSIAVSGKDYLLTLGSDSKPLTLNNGFTGDWLIGGEPGEHIVIGTINRLGEATGTFMGDAVTFSYDFKGNYLEFDWENLHLYVNALGKDDTAELAVGLTNNTKGSYSVCIRAEKIDAYAGNPYTAENGDSLLFDGLGESGFGHGIVFVKLDGETKEYYYETDDFGHVALKADLEKSAVYVIVPCPAGTEKAFGRSGEYLVMIKPDVFYNKTAYKAAANGEVDYESEYVFDGIGNVTCPEGNFTYVIESHDKTKYIYTFIFTDSQNGKYKIELGYGTGELIVTSFNKQ